MHFQKKEYFPAVSDATRIATAQEYFEKHLDPVGQGDTIIIAICIVIFVITGILMAYCWLHAHYRPIRAKNLPLNTIMLVVSYIAFSGNVIVNGHVNQVGGLQICSLWAIWIREFCTNAYCTALFLRVYALDLIFIQRRSNRGIAFYLPVGLILAAMLAAAITSQLVSGRLGTQFVPGAQICEIGPVYKWTNLSILTLLQVAQMTSLWRVRRIPSGFSEIREFYVIFSCGFCYVMQSIVLGGIIRTYNLGFSTRAVVTLFNAYMSMGVIWISLYQPVFNHIFHREEYLRKWTRNLANNDLFLFYGISDASEGADDGVSLHRVNHDKPSGQTGFWHHKHAGATHTTLDSYHEPNDFQQAIENLRVQNRTMVAFTDDLWSHPAVLLDDLEQESMRRIL